MYKSIYTLNKLRESKDALHFNNWQVPSTDTLRREFKVEHQMKGLEVWEDEDEFLNAVTKATTETITRGSDHTINYRSRTLNREELLSLIKGYRSYPEYRNEQTLDNIYQGFIENRPMEMPIVIEFINGNRRIFSGNTRMDAAQHLGIDPVVLIVKSRATSPRGGLHEDRLHLTTSLDLKLKTIYEQLVQESKQVGIVYHFTDVDNVRNMTSNFSDSSPKLRFNKIETQALQPSKDLDGYISTTRQYDFAWKLNSNEAILSIRFTLDGNRISQRYFIEPYDLYNRNYFKQDAESISLFGQQSKNPTRWLTSRGYKDERDELFDTESYPYIPVPYSTPKVSEHEERIWGKKGTLIPLTKYCLEVLLIVTPESVSQEDREEVLSIKQYFESLNLPVVVTVDPKPYGRSKEVDLKIHEEVEFNNWVKPSKDSLNEIYEYAVHWLGFKVPQWNRSVEGLLSTVEKSNVEVVSNFQLAEWLQEVDFPKTLVGLHNINLVKGSYNHGNWIRGNRSYPGQSKYLTGIIKDIKQNNPVELPVALRFRNQQNNLVLLASPGLNKPDIYGLMRMSAAKVLGVPVTVLVIDINADYTP